MNSVKEIYQTNLTRHQADLSRVISKWCIIGSFFGSFFYLAMKLTGIMSRCTWGQITLNFTIFTLSAICLLTISLIGKKNESFFTVYFKYGVILSGSCNYLALCICIPFNDIWATIIIMLFVSSFYIERKVVLFGIIINMLISILSFFFLQNTYHLNLADFITRVQMTCFGGTIAFISSIIGKKLLMRASTNEFDISTSMHYLEKVFDEIKTSAHVINDSSTNITTLSDNLHKATEITATNTTNVLDATIKTCQYVDRSIELLDNLSNDTKKLKEITDFSIKDSSILKESVIQGISSIDIAVQKILSIKEGAQIAYNSAQKLDSKAKQIDLVVSEIQSISYQTNLLAFNASIEASRAGESGKGFAVVAERIRMLANQSQQALKNIANELSGIFEHEGTVDNLVTNIDEGVTIILENKEFFTTIIDSLNNTINTLSNISNISEDQIVDSQVIKDFINSLSQLAMQTSSNAEFTSASVQQTFAASEELLDSAISLEQIAKKLVILTTNNK